MNLSSLPTHLAERARWIRPPAAAAPRARRQRDEQAGEFVLYWMHHAVRGHENPSLDVAISLARLAGVPLLIYHALCEQYPYASDRHHTFILQGARDVQREMSDRGIAYRFHLQRNGHRGDHLRDLARRATVLVSDEMPVQPISGWLQRLMATCRTPIMTVDASCVVPLPLVSQPANSAAEFHAATAEHCTSRLMQPYPEQAVDCEMFSGALPFEPLDLQHADFAALIAQCQIDHGVGAVAETAGGSRAGYRRWEWFKRHGLPQYASRRDNPADHGGTSRLSGYLHFGMISPLRIAREAAQWRTAQSTAAQAGADKYLDELLIQRELAFHFCHHRGDQIDSLDVLPRWAQQTLADHAEDPRQADHSWETLARGATGDPLWDLCQRSLLRHGELHNRLRTSWANALLKWSVSPQKALQLAIDLNHRYALDGRDPSSYGGLLGCFGLFGDPAEHEQPIFGSVRSRHLDEQRAQLDWGKYRRLVNRPIAADQPAVAIVGAGVAGLTAGRILADHGLSVRLFEKSRGVGGRVATRRTAEGLRFDHGAQYFSARDCRFSRYVRAWLQDGWVQPWCARVVQLRGGTVVAEKGDTPRYVARPGMSALAKHLATGLPTRLNTTVARLDKTAAERWCLRDALGQGLGEYDRVIVNCLPAQAASLLAGQTPVAAAIPAVGMDPCWAVLLHVIGQGDLGFDAAFVRDSPLAWICRNDSKPGRAAGDGACWVLHASADWSRKHVDADADEVGEQLKQAFAEATGQPLGQIGYWAAHRWRSAIAVQPLDVDCLWDPSAGLGVCGDWCGGARVEAAFLSGIAMAGSILRDLSIDRPAGRRSAAPLQR